MGGSVMQWSRWPRRLLVAGAAGLIVGGGAALAAAASLPALQQAVNQMVAEGVFARGLGPRYGPYASLHQAQVVAVLRRFAAHTGRRGVFTGAAFRLSGGTVVSGSELLVDIVNATGLHRGPSPAAALHTAERLGLVSTLPGLTAAPNAYASYGQLAVILVRIQQLGANAVSPSVPVPAAAAVLEGTITQVQTGPTGEVLSLSTGTSVDAVPVAVGAQVIASGQAISLTQLTGGMVADVTLNAAGQAQLITIVPAGSTPPPATVVSGTIASFANGQVSLEPPTPGAVTPSYAVAPSVVVTENGQGATSAALSPGDLVTLHVLSGTVTWIAIRAASSSLTGDLAAAVPGGFTLTESDGTSVRLMVPATAHVAAGSIALPRGALTAGEVVDVSGVAHTSGSLVAQSVTITGNAVAGTP